MTPKKKSITPKKKTIPHMNALVLPITKKDILVLKIKDECPKYVIQDIERYRTDLSKGLIPDYCSAILILPPGIDLQVLQVEKDYIDVSKLNLLVGKK